MAERDRLATFCGIKKNTKPTCVHREPWDAGGAFFEGCKSCLFGTGKEKMNNGKRAEKTTPKASAA
jgi:hypothetical protein